MLAREGQGRLNAPVPSTSSPGPWVAGGSCSQNPPPLRVWRLAQWNASCCQGQWVFRDVAGPGQGCPFHRSGWGNLGTYSPGLWTPPSSSTDRKVLGDPRMHKVTSAPGQPGGGVGRTLPSYLSTYPSLPRSPTLPPGAPRSFPAWAEKGGEDREDTGKEEGSCLPIPSGEAGPLLSAASLESTGS